MSSDTRALGLVVAAGAAIGVGATLSSALLSWILRQCKCAEQLSVSNGFLTGDVAEPHSTKAERSPDTPLVARGAARSSASSIVPDPNLQDPTKSERPVETSLTVRSAPGSSPSCAVLDPYSSEKRPNPLSWDDYFMALAFLSAQRSKDPNKQVGACIVSQQRIILSIGYNGFPRGIADESLPWAKLSGKGDPLETKYPYVCHAEANAILNANTNKMSGERIFVTMYPCNECAKLIIQAGLREVIYCEGKNPPYKRPADRLCYEASRRMLDLAGVKVRQHRLHAPITIGEDDFTIVGPPVDDDAVCKPCGADLDDPIPLG